MPGFNQTGPVGLGPMTGRRTGKCNPSDNADSGDKIKNAIIGLVAVLIIGLAESIWYKIKEKRLKSGSK